MTIKTTIRNTLAGITDHLAALGERTSELKLVMGPLHATIYPWHSQRPTPPANTPEPPKTCPSCGR